MFITVLIFIIILGILVFVHEFGHFIVAKKSGMQVDEFGFGFPPRIAGVQKINGKWKWIWSRKTVAPTLSQGERALSPAVESSTIYSINAIPLGGFVRIVGENNEDHDNPRSFINKGFWPRFFTLVAGVCMNVILACAIFIVGYMVGLPVAVDNLSDIPAHSTFSNGHVGILDVSAGQPAAKAGIQVNDILLALDGQKTSSISDTQNYITSHEGKPVTFTLRRGGGNIDLIVTPTVNPPAGEGATGIELALVGKLKYPIGYAVIEGVKTTGMELSSIVRGLWQLVAGHIGLSSLGGPVKIAKLTGQVASLGFIYLMQFTAFLSLNLAVLNILPFPALDGGRVLFLIIEKIRRKRNNQKVEQFVNTAGFVFLILLMVAVTINDIVRK